MERKIPACVEICSDQLRMMAALVERALERALRALYEQDAQEALGVIADDKPINSFEIDIDNSTYNLLTINQLPSVMLRKILSVQKINAVLERIGDHAVNIAESAHTLAGQKPAVQVREFKVMGEKCKEMLHDALTSFFNENPDLANVVLTADDTVDMMNVTVIQTIKEAVLRGEMPFEPALELIRISKNLERIADLSTNTAEETIFTVEGISVKHRTGSVSTTRDIGVTGEIVRIPQQAPVPELLSVPVRTVAPDMGFAHLHGE